MLLIKLPYTEALKHKTSAFIGWDKHFLNFPELNIISLGGAPMVANEWANTIRQF